MINVQPSLIHTALMGAAQTSTASSHKTDAPPPESLSHDKSSFRPVLSRSRRDLQNPANPSASSNPSVRQFAEALVEQSDRQLAVNVGMGLIRNRLDDSKNSSVRLDTIDVPPASTFGKTWGELADAINSEPFRSFAYAKNIDPLKLVINSSGRLSAVKDNKPVDFDLDKDPEWAAASAAVLAAAKKVDSTAAVVYLGPDRALPTTVARFYGLQPGNRTSNDQLSFIGQLLREGKFSTLDSSEPCYAAIKQRQKETRQHIEELPPHQLNQRLAQFSPPTGAQKVKEADQALSQLVSRAMMKLLPETSDYETSISLQDIPEYSTFNLVRKNLLTALTGSTFTAFAQDNNLDPTSVRINPVSGVLTGKVNGINTTFTLNDVSGWTDVWDEIKDAVQQMATDSDDDVVYTANNSARLYDVMAFYNEPPPHQEDTRQKGWEQRQLVATLGRIDEISQNKGFKALTDASPSDPAHIAVQQRQQSVIQQLANVPLVPSPLETLAAAVKTNIHTPVETEQTHTDLLATGDSELATTVHRTMLELKTNPTLAASKTIQPIPPNSLFGQWWDYLGKALKGHGFIEWASQHNIDLASLRYDRTGHALIAKVNGVEQRYTATDFAQKYPAFFDVIEPVLTAAQEFAAHGQQISLAQVGNSNVPYQWVANFYGISDDPSGPTFEQQTSLPGRTQQFPRPSADPQKVVTWLNRKKTELGDSNDRYSLIDQLRNWNSDSGSRRFIVDPASSLQPKGVTTVAAFLSRKDWNPTVTKADNDNLLAAIQTPAPQSPPLGNRWGFLSTQLSLSTEQRVTVGEFVKTSIGAHDSLLSYLSANVTDLSTDPEQALDQLVSSDAALELAAKLESQMKGAPTATSRKQWLLTALVLEIDRTAGAQHKTVAGIDLMGAAYSGHSVESIREQFGRDLAAKKGIPANLAPAISRLMMSGMAPQLLVKEVPQNVTLGSPEWVNFTTAVNRIEWTAPGATQGMTYQQVMNYNNIKPISALEAQIQNYAQMNPLLDWAALNNNVNKDNYTLEQLKDSQVKFQAQTKKTAESISWLSKSDPPNRRAMTLEILRKEFGPDIDYESRYMIEDEGFGINSGRHYSLAEIYETGRLGENWLQEGKHVDFERLRKRANEPDLPVVNDQFDKAIKQDFHLRRRHTVTLFENMLRKLPVEEQKSLLYGDVEFLNVEGAGSGMVMTSVYNGVRRDFAVYPASGLIVRIADIDPSTPMGQKVSLEIDAEAFKNGTFPKPGVKSDVVLRVTDQHLLDDNDEPWPLEVTFPAHSANDRFSPNYARGRLSKLANVMVDSTYLNKTQFLNLHRNWSSNTLETATEPSDFFKAIWHALPGTSSLEDLYHGQFLKAGVDLAIDVAIYAAAAGAGELWTLAKSGASWAAAKIEAGFIERFGAKDAESIALRDMTNTSVSQSLASSSRMQGSHIAEQTAEMANGTVVRAGTQEQVKVTAVNRAGNWYAYDAEADAAYGPALEGFRSDTSIGLKTETLPDGTSKQIPDRLLPEDAQVINRSTYSDVKIGNKVYRYDPKEPDVLTDLESADHFNDTHGLEAFCPAGPRVKRQTDGVCFAKVVSDFSGNTAKMVQGLEHTRLYPSSGGAGLNSTLVYERRLFDVVEKDGVYKTVQRDLVAPVDYLPTTRGTIVKDPHFGLSGADTLPNLEQNTRIVKLDAISSLSKDQRELRGTIAQTTTTSGATQRYIVVEADSLTFYYSKFDAKSTELTFKRIGESASEFELELVSNHIQEMEGLLEMAGAPLRKDFVSLPSLDSAFSKLEAAGYTPAQVNELKATIAPFNAEKKREFVYQLINKLTSSSDELVLKSASLEPLDKTADFANLAAEKQNKFYAEGAKNSVNTQVKATGIGSSNKRIPNKPNDIYREEVAEALVGWIQDIKIKSPNYVNSVLKFGAGNCGEIAEAATQIIKKSGGSAETWYVHGGDHAFTVVGGPASAGKSTVNFAEAEWKDAWIVDPWADISCKASNYTALLEKKMTQWESSGLEIYINGDWRSPLYPKWRTELMTFEKRPLYAE